MRNLTALCILALAACSSLPDTPIGNYPTGPVTPLQQLRTFRCVYDDGTELIVRGAKGADACPVIERKTVARVIAV
jgi:hypothetical protein